MPNAGIPNIRYVKHRVCYKSGMLPYPKDLICCKAGGWSVGG